MADQIISQEYLREIFDYKDGKLFYKNKTHKFSKIKIGDEVGSLYSNGYLNVKLHQKPYPIHRIIFMMFNGFFPKTTDHIDGNKLNNRIENLRECDHVTNGYNRKLGTNNTSGHKNVVWSKKLKKWRVTLLVNKKFNDFGYFDDLELASLVALEARNKYHKHFAREK
jgi:hypothetical protein